MWMETKKKTPADSPVAAWTRGTDSLHLEAESFSKFLYEIAILQ